MHPEQFDETQEQARALTEESGECHYRSKLNFLKSHNGLRKNKMHMLIAPTHSGKSTFVRSIVRDIVFNNQDKKILIMLSEESVKEFKEEFYKGVPVGSHLKNLLAVSQKGSSYSREEFKARLLEIIEFYGVDTLIFDNITTSENFYQDQTVATQGESFSWLKKISSTVTVFIIAHTNTTDYNNRLLNENDIRGGKTAVNLVEFLYIMQPVIVGDDMHQFILIKKNRGQSPKDKIYKLKFRKEIMAFSEDFAVPFEELKRIFKLRNRLDGK